MTTSSRKGKPVRWSAYLIKGKRRQWVGTVEARDEAEALEKAARELEIAAKDRFRISVGRD